MWRKLGQIIAVRENTWMIRIPSDSALGSRIRPVFEHSHHYCESAIRVLVPGGQTLTSIP
jgi:hypothetical protein